jgi:hydroxymethylpyrimidine pyrophosphatase-like HAD family hydrolase
VDAIVAENGAVALLPDRAGLAEGAHATVFVDKRYQQDAATRGVNGARMQQVAARVLREVPGATLAQDSAGRETDIAIDHSEFAHLDAAQIAQVLRILQGEGMSATVSSIHVNAWYGAHNKLEGARWIVRQLLGRELDAQKDDWVFVGDSGNDQLLFEFFENSVAVANIRHCEAQLQHRPRYVTNSERGAGFAEVATAILTGRGLGPASAAFRHRAPKES